MCEKWGGFGETKKTNEGGGKGSLTGGFLGGGGPERTRILIMEGFFLGGWDGVWVGGFSGGGGEFPGKKGVK